MTKKQFRARLRLLIVLTLVLLGLIGFASGKYVQDRSFDGKVTFKASLASDVILQEHTAQRQTDGSYKLVEPFVSQNTYYLIPGLDIPKDPHIIIEGKTPIEAYLFVEVVSSLDAPVTYSVDTSLWTKVDVTSKHGGTVYRYMGEGFPENPIYILSGNTVTVSQNLLKTSVDDGDDLLTFYVYLIEKVGSASAEEAYRGYTTP